jgi:DNA modification methylase
MREMDAESVDAVVCDPPYGLEFMGKEWDRADSPAAFAAWCEAWAREAYRVLKPGGHLLAFGGTRTFHRLTCGIEDAGFEVRDCLSWLYGSGFPKSLDVSKAIDKQRHDRYQVYEVTAWIREARDTAGIGNKDIDAAFGFAGMAGHWTSAKSQPAVPTIEQVEPLLEVLGVAPEEVPPRIAHLLLELNGRKGQPGEAWFRREVTGTDTKARSTNGKSALPTMGGDTVYETWDITAPATDAAREWEGWGTALKPAWEPCVVARKPLIGTVAANVQAHGTGALNVDGCRIGTDGGGTHCTNRDDSGRCRGHANAGRSTSGATFHGPDTSGGRWPANVALDEDAAAILDAQSGQSTSRIGKPRGTAKKGAFANSEWNAVGTEHNDTGGASRFFYTAKASRADRTGGGVADNTHPTVKPTDLMRWLVRLVTPPGGVVLDPFAGSGSTLVAARAEGVRAVGIEREPEYADIITARLAQLSLFSEGMGE